MMYVEQLVKHQLPHQRVSSTRMHTSDVMANIYKYLIVSEIR
jgi:hypothetical protein